MFQADYHLKELSMGEFEQPVLGMKSCMDMDRKENDEEWSGREWFIVRKAEMQVSEDGVLIPFLKMGVEAREQVQGPDGLEDSPVTRPNHPLVLYAEAFTKNFDLIAERKGVVYQLRELAKASIMAKYLLESGLRLGEPWFQLAAAESPAYCMEVPQLWNDRCYSTIEVKDGVIFSAGKGDDVVQRRQSMYGGVDFGIDRFRLSAPSRVATSVVAGRAALGRPASSLMATTAAGLSMGPARQFTRLAGPLSTMGMAAPSRLAAPFSAISMAGSLRSAALAPQGVDLNLDKFNLSAATQVSSQTAGSNANLAIGSAFWAELDGEKGGRVLSDEDKSLFREVFNPFLSDRRGEGEAFAPPPTSYGHIQSLKRLVKEEESLRQRRTEQFSSNRFSMEEAGPLFPSSWTSSLQVSHITGLPSAASGSLVERPEYKSQAGVLSAVLASVTPLFDKYTEDGARFRIYTLGSLEVRTMQEHGSQETVCAVFSIAASSKPVWGAACRRSLSEHDRLAKVTEFVERSSDASLARHSYVVLESELGDVVVTEKLSSGAVVWRENPSDLEFRNSLAKVIRSTTCSKSAATVGEMKKFQITQDGRDGAAASRSTRKRYAQLAFCKAVGGPDLLTSGFHRRVGSGAAARPWIRTAPARPFVL
mmetsp:Transcript_45781/g.116319  ORF Transcript_45781/g.116319 Transcript_45781/m.116319 type:complete len:649 (-) Transcript_45781:203-2149(-)